MANRRRKVKAVTDLLFLGSKITAGSDCSREIKRRSLEGKLWQTRHCIKRQRHYSADKGLHSQNYGFSSTHVQMWELDHKEGWTLKNWCFWIVVLEKILLSRLDYREIKTVNPKGNQPWISIGKTDAEAEAPILWPPDGKVQLFGKDPDAGKDWRQRRRGTPEEEMVGWHHWLSGHEFEQTLGDSGAQKSLLCCSPWGLKELDTTEQQWQPVSCPRKRSCWIFGKSPDHSEPQCPCLENGFLLVFFSFSISPSTGRGGQETRAFPIAPASREQRGTQLGHLLLLWTILRTPSSLAILSMAAFCCQGRGEFLDMAYKAYVFTIRPFNLRKRWLTSGHRQWAIRRADSELCWLH